MTTYYPYDVIYTISFYYCKVLFVAHLPVYTTCENMHIYSMAINTETNLWYIINQFM